MIFLKNYFFLYLVLFFISCSNDNIHETSRAISVIQPANNSEVKGIVFFEQHTDHVDILVKLSGLTPNQQHGFHVHQFGDISSEDGKSAGSHYNPEGHSHSLNNTSTRHAGDLGNLKANENGEVDYSFKALNISINDSKNPIIGRALIIHAKPDDGGQPTGNAGSRIGMGVIGIAK